MSSVVGRVLARATAPVWRAQRAARPVRTAVTSGTGSLAPKPIKHYSLGLVRLTLAIVPFVYCGAVMGQTFAESLEKYDLFVPDDDDDD